MNGQRVRGASNGMGPDDTVANRAALFEDEKRRIIESCFTKKEPDGSFAESYITHIRVTEDASSPSTPPPPDSASDNKKSRAIIVAVKRSGRVRLHKARENPQGTFSIGKTWVLDDLTAIDSWTGFVPTTHDEQLRKEWAGATGVLLTIQKPYFWQIATQKEKDFFVGSLIKIYRKYTKGREPRLSGFTAKELSDFGVTGQPPPLAAAQRTSAAPAEPSPYASPSPAPAPSPSPFAERSRNRPPSADSNTAPPFRSRDLRPPSADSNSAPPNSYLRSAGVTPRNDEAPSRFQELRNVSNASSIKEEPRLSSEREESIRSRFAANSSRESLPQDTPVSSISNDKTRINGSFAAFPRDRNGPGLSQRPLDSPRRVPSVEQGFGARSGSSERRAGFANRAVSESSEAREVLPERRRPPIVPASASPAIPDEPSIPRSTTPASVATTRTDPGSFVDKPRNAQLHATNGDGTADESPGMQDISRALSPASPIDSLASPMTPNEEHRPGLGPMIRKKKSAKEIADTFRRAATAAGATSAFKPRAGGAAERLQREGLISKSTAEATGGDGITGVFVARPKETRKIPEPVPTPTTLEAKTTNAAVSKDAKHISDTSITQIDDKLAASLMPQPLSFSTATKATDKPPQLEDVKELPEKRKPPPDRSAYYAKILGCDAGVLEGRTSEIDAVLDDFGWTSNFSENTSRKTVEELQTDIKRDLAKLESGSWLSVMETGDDRVAQVSKLIENAIHECDELDGLLTLYNVELGTLADDVAYIEAQSQGLQVQTANQRLLQTELQNLLDTITIPEQQLDILARADYEGRNFLQDISGALIHLYKAMITIDPSIKASEDKDAMNRVNADVSNMRAVKDQKDKYSRASLTFVQTFNEQMAWRFRAGQKSVRDALQPQRMHFAPGEKIDHNIRNKWRDDLLYYSPIVLFEREIQQQEHENLLQRYASLAADPYKEQFKATVQAWQQDTKTTSGSEDVLFTAQDKESEGMSRKLTVKRSKTVLKAEGPRGLGINGDQGGKLEAYKAFSGALLDLSRAILLEQNFVTALFHLHSSQALDFPEFIEKAAVGAASHTNLIESRGFESKGEYTRALKQIMEQIFPYWSVTLTSTIDQVINDDILNSFGVLFSIQDRLNSLSFTSQDFLSASLSHAEEYVDRKIRDLIRDQVKAIDDQKVKLKKRTGVLSFMRIFPLFVKSIEAQLPYGLSPETRIRKLISEHYANIIAHMLQSLRAIAKDSGILGMGSHKPQGLHGAATDAEDKEILNYHILLIENTHHFIEDVPDIPDEAIQTGRADASKEMAEHLELYVHLVIRRPLGKLLDFIETTEGQIKSAPDGPGSIANKASHSKSAFKRLLSTYDAREISKGIDALKKRVNKHFAEADEAVISQTLVARVLTACKDKYEEVLSRTSTIVNDVYEGSLEVEFKREDIQNAFKRV